MSNAPHPPDIDVTVVGIDLTGSEQLKRELEKLDRARALTLAGQVEHELGKIVGKIVADSSCIKTPRGFPNGFDKAQVNYDSIRLLFFSPWKHFDARSAIESALRIRAAWDSAQVVPALTADGCPHHPLGIAVHVERLSQLVPLSDREALNLTDTFRLIAAVKETPPSAESFVVATEACVRRLGVGAAVTLSGPVELECRKKPTDPSNIIRYYVVDGDIERERNECASPFFFVRHGLVDVKADGLCPPVDPAVVVTLARQLKTSQLSEWIGRSKNRIRILQTYIPSVESLAEDFFKALEGGTNVEILLLQPVWKLARLQQLLPKDIIVGSRKSLGLREVPSIFAIQRNLELDSETHGQFPSNIMVCRRLLEAIPDRHGPARKPKATLQIRYYDAIPGVALHVFDDTMFVGFYLKNRFALESPQFVIVKRGQPLFESFEREFEQLWAGGQ